MGDFDIAWFQVPVNDAFLVRGLHGFANLDRQSQRLFYRYRPALYVLCQCFARDELENQEVRVVRVFQAVNGRDIRMVERRALLLRVRSGQGDRSLSKTLPVIF
jgi:hypothetical protein